MTDTASKIKTDATLARHFQRFREVEIEILDSLMKKHKDDEEFGVVSVLQKYVRCKFV